MYIWCDMVYSDFRCLSESSASDCNWFVVLSYQYWEWPRFKIQPWNVVRPGNLHPVTNIFCAWVDPVCFCSKNQAQPTPAIEPERFSLQKKGITASQAAVCKQKRNTCGLTPLSCTAAHIPHFWDLHSSPQTPSYWNTE